MLRGSLGGSFGSFVVLFRFFCGSLPQNFRVFIGSFWQRIVDLKVILRVTLQYRYVTV
jgi:hypothetical protein